MGYCSNCGNGVAAEDRFCESCGADVEDVGKGGGGAGSGQPKRAFADQRPGAQPPTQDYHDSRGGIRFGFGYPLRTGWKWMLGNMMLLFIFFVGVVVLSPIGFLFILPLLLVVFGYAYRLSRDAALGEAYPPGAVTAKRLLIDGLRLFVFILVLFGVLQAVLERVVVPAFPYLETGFDVAGASGPEFAVLALLAVFGYVTLAIVVAFVGSNSLVSAFTDGKAFSLLTSRFYVKAFVLFLPIVVVAFLMIIIVGGSGSTGFLLIPFVYAYVLMVWSAYLGYVYHQAAEKGIVPPAGDEPSADESAPRGAGQPSQ